MAWSNEWKTPSVWPMPKEGEKTTSVHPANPIEISVEAKVLHDVIVEAGEIILDQFPKVYNNLSPTHDPYTNPNAYIYYECDCGAILDPHAKSFAALNNAASERGWKVRWNKNGLGYQPFCVKCGEDVE